MDSRWAEAQAIGILAHPNRQRLYTYIAANPGCSRREAARGAGLVSSTAIHHMNRLLRAGNLVERKHGHSFRLFPAAPASPQDQLLTILLREPQVKAVYEWVATHPLTSQKPILDAMQEAHGMSRSTTQHRLARLLRHGVIEARPLGAQRTSYLAFEVPA